MYEKGNIHQQYIITSIIYVVVRVMIKLQVADTSQMD
jgi:hypothetical protein